MSMAICCHVTIPRIIRWEMAVRSLALAALLTLSLAALTRGQGAPNWGWIVAGEDRQPTCSFCVNGLGGPDINSTWIGLAVGIYRCVKFDSNELWVIDNVTNTIFLTGPGNQTLCIDAGSQPDYDGRNDTYEPMSLRTCDGSLRQRWLYNSTAYNIRSGLTDANGSTLYMVVAELGVLPAIPSDSAAYYNLLLATPASLASAPGFVTASFTFNAAADYDSLAERIPEDEPGNLVRNGGFERATVLDRWPPWRDCSTSTCSQTVLYAGELFTLCSWRTGNPPDWANQLQPYWTAAHGNSSLLLSYGASINQTIATQPGSEYLLSFALAGQLARNVLQSGGYVRCPGQGGYVSVQVGNSSAFLFSLQENEISTVGEATNWVIKTMRFVAAEVTPLLIFANTDYSQECGPVIDDIRVSLYNPPTPAPSITQNQDVLALVLGSALPAAAVLASIVVGGVVVIRRRRKASQPFPHSTADITGAEHNVRKFSYAQIRTATSEWSTIVGKGGFSTVYRAQFPEGVTGAVKVENNRETLPISLFKEELAVLLRVNHRYLVNLIGFCAEQDHRILVFEYLPNGTLYERLHTDKHAGLVILPWTARMKIIYQVSCALEYLHHGTSPTIVHRDIKSANILLTAADSAKLADLGLSKSAPPDTSGFHTVNTDVRGSLGYLDPKYLRSGEYSLKSDVYSFGVLLLEIISGHPAIKDLDLLTYWAAQYINDPLITHQMVDSRVGDEGSWSSTDLSTLVDVVKMCLQQEPQQRPTMEQVVSLLVDSGFSGCPPSTPVAVPDTIRSSFSSPPSHSGSSTTFSASVASTQKRYYDSTC